MKVNVEFEINSKSSDEWIHCHIPEIDTYFSAKSEDDVIRKGKAAIKSFVQYWNEQNGGVDEEALKMWNEI